LIRSQNSQSAFWDTDNIYQSDEVNALMVHTVPTSALAPFPKSLAVLGPVVANHVMFSGNVEDVRYSGIFEHFAKRIEFLGLGKMAQVAGVDNQIGLLG